MSHTCRSLAIAFLVAIVSALVVSLGAPATAADGPKPAPPSQFNGSGSGSTGVIQGTQPGTQSTPSSGSQGNGSSSSSGSSGSSGGSGSSSTPPLLGTGVGTGACDPASYPGGYSPTLAVPSPCAPVQQCGAYQGSVFVAQACPTDPANPAAPVAPVITTQMVTEAARVVAPVNPPHVEPGNLSFVNIPNNYWATSPTVNASVTVLGVTIPLVWTPTGTTWDFGDGATATGNGVEGADVGAAGAVEHAYARQGSYPITTSTSYNLTFVLPGGGAQTIPLTSPPSPAVVLPVREIQTLDNYAR